MHGADPFATSPALRQSAALGETARRHKTQGLLVPRSALGCLLRAVGPRDGPLGRQTSLG